MTVVDQLLIGGAMAYTFARAQGQSTGKSLVEEDKMIHIDALPLYKKYTDVFLMGDVPEDERKAVARQVADKIVAKLKKQAAPTQAAT